MSIACIYAGAGAAELGRPAILQGSGRTRGEADAFSAGQGRSSRRAAAAGTAVVVVAAFVVSPHCFIALSLFSLLPLPA